MENCLLPLAPVVTASATNANEDQPRLVLQPVTKPISAEQLTAEVKGIYAGLIMVEAKCSEVDAKQYQASLEMASKSQQLSNEQW